MYWLLILVGRVFFSWNTPFIALFDHCRSSMEILFFKDLSWIQNLSHLGLCWDWKFCESLIVVWSGNIWFLGSHITKKIILVNDVSRGIFILVYWYECVTFFAQKKVNITFFTLIFSIIGYISLFFFQVQTHTLSTEDYSNAWKTFTLKGFHVTDGHQHFYVELLDMLHSLWKHFAQKTSGYVTACCHNHHMFFWLISFVLGIFSLGFVEWV